MSKPTYPMWKTSWFCETVSDLFKNGFPADLDHFLQFICLLYTIVASRFLFFSTLDVVFVVVHLCVFWAFWILWWLWLCFVLCGNTRGLMRNFLLLDNLWKIDWWTVLNLHITLLARSSFSGWLEENFKAKPRLPFLFHAYYRLWYVFCTDVSCQPFNHH